MLQYINQQYHIILVAGFVFILMISLAWRAWGGGIALIVALVKISIPVVYFSIYPDGYWKLLDDQSYYEIAYTLLDRGQPVFWMWGADGVIDAIVGVTGSTHWVYYWLCMLQMKLLGVEYFALVFGNVLISAAAAVVLHHYLITKRSGLSLKHCRSISVFAALSPAVLSWTSFIALRDIWVVFFMLTTLYLSVAVFERGKKRYIILLIASSYMLWGVRSYMLPFVGIMVLVDQVIFYKSKGIYTQIKRMVSIGVIVIIAVVTLARFGTSYMSLNGIMYSFIRMLLTPLPWNISDEYVWLTPSALFYLLSMPFLILGSMEVMSKIPRLMIMPLLFISVCLLYALVPGEQGPRYRFQVEFCASFMQYIGFQTLIDERSRYRWFGRRSG